jgi:hypothetical protein
MKNDEICGKKKNIFIIERKLIITMEFQIYKYLKSKIENWKPK